MSSIICERLKGHYPEDVILQIEKIYSDKGRLPSSFYLNNVGHNTISCLLKDLGYKEDSWIIVVYAPEGSKSSRRKITLYKKKS